MEKINFDFLKAGVNEGRFAAVAKTTKVSNEIRPEFIANISINKMCLNGLASQMLQVQNGDFLKAMVLTNEQCGGDANKKFFIMVSKTKSDDMMAMASVGREMGYGKKLFLSYAACYSQFLQATADAQAVSPDSLEQLGLAYHVDKVGKDGKAYKKYTANREVHFELVDTEVDYPNENGEMLRIYACVNPHIVERPYDATVEAEEAEEKTETAVEDVRDAESVESEATESEEEI